MKKWTKALALVLVLALLSVPVLAATGVVDAKLTYRGIKITLDGKEIETVDAKGNSTEAFIMNDSTYLPVRAIAEALGLGVQWDDATSTVVLYSDPTLLRAIVVNMGSEKGASMRDPVTLGTEAYYAKYYKQGSAAEGLKAIIAAGEFYINGTAVPANETEFDSFYADGYRLNGTAILTRGEEGKWKATSKLKDYDTYAEAALAVVTEGNQFNGQEVDLFDKDGDGYADRIEMRYVSAVIVNAVTDHGDGTVSLDRGAAAANDKPVGTEKVFDGALFADDTYRIPKEYFDETIAEGDMALIWYEQDNQSWHAERAVEVRDTLTEAVDHDHYTMGATVYGDAMKFSRDNLPISNRNGEFANASMYFGFTGTASLWLVPTPHSAVNGAPIGFTSGDNAKANLTAALAAAQQKLDSAAVSADGSGLAAGDKWVTQETHDQLAAAIARAQTALDTETRGCMLDYQVYLLYLTLHGSANDIGAKFAGYDYIGFDNQITEVK